MDTNSNKESDDKISLSQIRPTLAKLNTPEENKDPVREQKKRDVSPPKKALEIIPEKGSITSARIEPTLSTRIGLHSVNEGLYKPGTPRIKYEVPKTKKQQQYIEQHRANTAKKFCKYGFTQVPKPTTTRKMDVKLEVPSPEPSKAKVAPRAVSPRASWLYPDPQDRKRLDLKKPKSGIFINESEEYGGTTDYDSFDLVYSRKPRPDVDFGRKRKRKGKSRTPGGDTLEDILEDEEMKPTKKKKKKKKRKQKIFRENGEIEERGEEEEVEGGEENSDFDDYLTKQFRRKVSQISQATSYQSKDIASLLSEKEILEEPAINKYIQKFRRDSEIKQFSVKKRKFKRGTLESHSFTDINQTTLKDFFFGSKEGSMHQGDASFPDDVRDKQGLCMSVAAYCFSILKHPNKWTSQNIDEILEYGNNLYMESMEKLHMHSNHKDFRPEMLQKYCTIREKKIRIVVEDPEVTGYIRSDNKTVYNLTKALKIFFARQSSGILKTQELSIAVWKDKYYYMFDAKPRSRDLYCSPTGTAIMANFYDIPSLVTVFLDRSNFGNWPFIIYPIKGYRILNKDDPEVESSLVLESNSNYNILNENKAVVLASFDLADKCFDFTRNKQSLPMAVVCLVYSRITPPSAWHRSTLDKIMIIGNQLYTECMECDSINTLRLDNLPAIFTIGPYIVEIYIYANVYADIINKNCCCQLQCCLEQFFDKSTNAILHIEKCHLAVWKQRNMYYCFDPYSRNNEGFKCRDGFACVSMHSNLDSLVETITTNFASDAVFYMHALKVCKIHRDPVQSSRFPKHLTMDQFPVDDFKQYKMKKSKKAAIEKPVTVDYSALAMRRLLAGESPDISMFEIGSTVESLGMEQIPQMMHKHPSKSILKSQPKMVDVIADLDSPSLSDTQIYPPLPQQPKMTEEIEFMDLDSFELTMEEIELQDIEPEYNYNLSGGEEEYEGMGEGEYEDYYEGMDMEDYFGEDDWYYAMNRFAQASIEREPSKISEQINTDITYFPIKREILYPTYLRGKQQMKYRLQRYKFTTDDNWDNYFPPEPDVSKSEELRKITNFFDLPDGTEIIKGTKNVVDVGTDIEFIAPFVCIMAGVVSKKYSILSWSGEIVDYILKCGNELYAASKFRYDQVSKLEIPRISLGNTNFTVLVEYIFDTYTRQNILELAIDKILFIRSDVGVLVTPTYACALFYKNHLYYMYDCFGNNDVGLSEGPNNKGVACFSRFKDVHSLSARIMYNKKKREINEEVMYSRFVLSTVKVKQLHETKEDAKKKDKKSTKAKRQTPKIPEEAEDGMTDVEDEPIETEVEEEENEDEGKEAETEQENKIPPKNKVGYTYKNGRYIIEGTKSLQGRKIVSIELKEDHFVCICACLMLLTCPIRKWDTNKVDQVLDYGKHVHSHADDYNISEKRTIKNVLIQKNFFDVIVNMIKIENWRNNKNLSIGIDTLLLKKLSYFMVQFGNACYVVHKSQDETFHLFDPYSVWKGSNAGWLKCKNLRSLKWRLKRLMVSGGESYTFYNFEVTSIKRAPKDVLISQRLQEYEIDKMGKKEYIGKPFYEDVEWLRTDPIPWTRRVAKSAEGKYRGKLDNQWHNWDVEYPKDLYSLMGNIHQFSLRFSSKTRGKQTLANLVTALGMMEIYDLAEWNAAVIDSILVNGDNYFQECIQDINEGNYEISIDDLKEECTIFPFSFKATFTPIVEGTMFLIRVTQFNLYKALRYFFNRVQKRLGIICCSKADRKRQVAFGKLQESEYFMFDCDCLGDPMFLEGCGVAYILRTTTLNRLLHVLTLTLRGGDFYIYDVDISNLQPIS